MAIQVSSIAELEVEMMKQVRDAMIDAETNMRETIAENINKEVYQAYTPKVYERTYGLKSSLITGTYEIMSTTICSYIKHDPNYANWFSVQTGEKNDYVPDIVNYGEYGTFNGVGYDGAVHHLNPSGTIWGQPRHYMYMSEREYGNDLEYYLPDSATIYY